MTTPQSPKFCILISYDGTLFHGWQKQPQKRTIQQELEQSLFQITRENIHIVGAGRTDAGVHACGQVAHFSSGEAAIFSNPEKLCYSLNATLPPAITIRKISIVQESFHSRYSSSAKEYRYRFFCGQKPPPFIRNFCTKVHSPINIETIKECFPLLTGTHDFKAFSNTGRIYSSTIRTIYHISITELDESLWELRFIGNGFLYKMVRNIVGALLHIGKGKDAPRFISHILSQQNRNIAPETAPPQGLFLYKVDYPSNPFSTEGSLK